MNDYYKFCRVEQVTPLCDYKLKVSFEDKSTTKIFDVTPYLNDPFWAPLKNETLFKRVYADGLSVAWPGDIDIAPEEVWHHST